MLNGIRSSNIVFNLPVKPGDSSLLNLKDMCNYTQPVQVKHPAGMGTMALLTTSASFDQLTGACYLPFQDKLFALAGLQGTDLNPFMFYSSDGIVWKSVRSGFTPRSGACAVEFRGNLYLLGGDDGTGDTNDIWVSANGFTWNKVVTLNSFTARSDCSAVVFNGDLYLLAGTVVGAAEVWKTSDGVNWVLITSSAAFAPCTKTACVVFNGLMWVIGGLNAVPLGTIYNSPDGITWTLATTYPSGVYGHQVISLYNRLYMLCGNDGSPTTRYAQSLDGINWTTLPSFAGVTARDNFGFCVFKGSLVIFGGAADTHGMILPLTLVLDEQIISYGNTAVISDQDYHELFIFSAMNITAVRFCSLVGGFWNVVSAGLAIVGDQRLKYVPGAVCTLVASDRSGSVSFTVQSVSFNGTVTTIVPVEVLTPFAWDFVCLTADQTEYLAGFKFITQASFVDSAVDKFLAVASLKPQGSLIDSSGLIDVLSDRIFVTGFYSDTSLISKAVVLRENISYKVKICPKLRIIVKDEFDVTLLEDNLTVE